MHRYIHYLGMGGWWDRKILTVFLWFLRTDLDPIYLDFRTRWHAKSYRFYVQYGLNIALLSAADWRPRITPANPFRAEKAARFIYTQMSKAVFHHIHLAVHAICVTIVLGSYYDFEIVQQLSQQLT